MRVIQGGESFTTLTDGLQDAITQLGGMLREHRTDRLPAAYRNLGSATEHDDDAKVYAVCRKQYDDPEPLRLAQSAKSNFGLGSGP